MEKTETVKPKPKPKRKRKPTRFSKRQIELDYLFHTTRQEVFWSELIQTAFSMDAERLKRKAHNSYVV